MTTKTIDGIDWEFILETIKNEKCILFIGPEIFKNTDGTSLEEQIATHMDVGLNRDIQSFYPEDGLFLFTSGTKKTKSYYRLKNFYQQEFPQAQQIYRTLAKTPFHFVISITPDDICFQSFRKEGIAAEQDFYWKKKPVKNDVKTPSKNKPLIYNMFGFVQQQESMVLTHDDLFEYFESIFQENSMPEKLKLNIKNADNFIFLGLDFEKWYMQLLLRILYLHNEQYQFMRYAANQQLDDQIKTFCYQQFRIEFIPTKINEFVETLYSKCLEKDIARDSSVVEESAIEKYIKWVAEDKTEEVIAGFTDFLRKLGEKGRDLLDDLSLLSNRYRRLKRKTHQGVIDSDNASLENNKISKSLLDLLNEAGIFE